MRKLTTEERNTTIEIMDNTSWVNSWVTREFAEGKKWNEIIYELAVMFKVIEAEEV